MDDQIHWLHDIISTYLPKIILAIGTLVIGWIVIGWVTRFFGRTLKRSHLEPSVSHYFRSLVSIFLKVLLIFSVASTFGIVTTSFVAILGAAAFAIGMALQGSLSHFAAGVVIMIFKPYRIGDFVEAGGTSGTVKEIGIFTTQMTTLANDLVFVPNGQILEGTIVNYSRLPERQLVMDFKIGYKDDIDQARKIIHDLFLNHDSVLKEKGIQVLVTSQGDQMITLSGRAWTKSGDYWSVNFYMNENVKKEFDKAGLVVPYKELGIHYEGNHPSNVNGCTGTKIIRVTDW